MSSLQIAYHEAGHFVIGYRLDPGRYRLSVTIRPDQSTLGQSVEEEPSTYSYTDESLEVEVISFYAGYAAEYRFAPEHADKRGSESDYAKASRLLRFHSNAPTEQSLEARAAVLVEENWTVICALAQELLKHETLDADHAELIIDALDEGEDPAPIVARYLLLRDSPGHPE